MKKIIKILTGILIIVVIVCGTSFLTDKTSYSSWETEDNPEDGSFISWAKFEWTNGESAGKHYDKLSMNIPCKINGLPNIFTFQFDLGANLTGVYETTYNSLHFQETPIQNKIERLRSRLQFWNRNKYFKDLSIHFGSYTAINRVAFVYKNFGEKAGFENIKDTIHIGTIGADIFKNKVLMIDYPNKQFAICEHVPASYNTQLADIELDKNGRVILPMKIHNRKYRILFDNGSSIFPLITKVKNMSNYTTSADIDTIQISSWGQIHSVTGKLIKDTFELAGQNYSNVKIYANHSGWGIDDATDGMAGNALFWDKTIIIDFKNKKFGIK